MTKWQEHVAAMSDEERAKWADRIAGAREDGGPSPGADFLSRLRKEFGVSSNDALLQPLLGDEDVDDYMRRHWQAGLEASRSRGKKSP